MNTLRKKYTEEIAVELKKDLGLKNVMEVPRINKVVINSGIGEFRDNREAVELFAEELGAITGQKPSPRKARLSESGFKVRKGEVVGYSVTLRADRMWAFIEKLVNVALPRVRDFKGINTTSFDANGNYSLGIKEHAIFPEINPNKIKGIRGLQVTINMKSKDSAHSLALLEKLGFPFKKD